MIEEEIFFHLRDVFVLVLMNHGREVKAIATYGSMGRDMERSPTNSLTRRVSFFKTINVSQWAQSTRLHVIENFAKKIIM